MPSFKLSQPGAVKPGRLLAPFVVSGLLFAGLLIAVPVFPAPLRAEVRSAETAASDRALGEDAAAYHALQEGRNDDAANLLRATLAANPADALAHQLLCRVFYAQDVADEAIRECELAVSRAGAASDLASDNNLWLGRAYGMKARRAGPVAGFTLARKVEASFARAVELNPGNVAALNDLGEYYVAAPFIIGGGPDRARALAARIMPRFPGAAHRLLARLADSDNNLATAESEFKQAVAAERSPGAWIDLAQFYQTHARPDDALAAVKSALAADRTHGPDAGGRRQHPDQGAPCARHSRTLPARLPQLPRKVRRRTRLQGASATQPAAGGPRRQPRRRARGCRRRRTGPGLHAKRKNSQGL